MFFPISTEKMTVQRWPIVTATITIICLLLLIVTNTVIALQRREIHELWMKKLLIESKYIFDEGLGAIYGNEGYGKFEERMRAGEIIDKDSREYKIWEKVDSEYKKKSTSTIFHVLGFIPSKFWRVHTLFTSVLVHGGVVHFLGNMWFLWVLGCNIEDIWGRRNFLLFFFAAGIVATFLHSLINFGSEVPTIGASGAIAGVMGAFMIRNYRTKIKFFYFLYPHPALMGTVLVPAWVAMGLYLLFDLFYGVVSFGRATGTAYWAHVGGFLAGIGTAVAFKTKGIEEKYITPKLEEGIEAVKVSPLMDRAFKEREKGNFEKAVKLLEQLTSQQPENVDAYREMANIQTTINKRDKAADAFTKVIHLSLQKGEQEAALNTYYEMKVGNISLPLGPDDLYGLAGALYRKGRVDEALQMYQQLIKKFPGSTVASKGILKCATVFSERDQNELALSAFQYLLSKYPDIEWKSTVLSEIESLKRRMPKKSE